MFAIPVWHTDPGRMARLGGANLFVAAALTLVAVPALALSLQGMLDLTAGPLHDGGVSRGPTRLEIVAYSPLLAWCYFILAIPVLGYARRNALFGLGSIILGGVVVGSIGSLALSVVYGGTVLPVLGLLGAGFGALYALVFWIILRVSVPGAFRRRVNVIEVFA